MKDKGDKKDIIASFFIVLAVVVILLDILLLTGVVSIPRQKDQAKFYTAKEEKEEALPKSEKDILGKWYYCDEKVSNENGLLAFDFFGMYDDVTNSSVLCYLIKKDHTVVRQWYTKSGELSAEREGMMLVETSDGGKYKFEGDHRITYYCTLTDQGLEVSTPENVNDSAPALANTMIFCKDKNRSKNPKQ